MRKLKNFILALLQWVLVAICLLLVLAFFPSLSSLLGFLAALLFLPVAPVRRLIGKIIPSWTAQMIIAFVLCLASIMTAAPADTDNTPEDPDTVQTAAEETEPVSKSPEEIRAEYISGCETVVYKDVERNPSDFEGKYIAVTGEVIQVSEGWFNSVTLRIKNEDGTWYATYTREDDEPRILEDDIITAYGECTGVETYSTVLGAKMTIPAMEIEYYDLIEE